MKVLFLDHDGVICLPSQWGRRFSKKSKKRGDVFDPFCPKAIKVLNEIIIATDCEIVISSDWRIYKDIEYMKNLYIDRGIIKSPIGYTNIFDIDNEDIVDITWEYKDKTQMLARVREKEIMDWLEKNKVAQWVAVDDLNMKKLKNFVHCSNQNEGIKKIGLKNNIISILNGS